MLHSYHISTDNDYFDMESDESTISLQISLFHVKFVGSHNVEVVSSVVKLNFPM